MPTDKFHTRYNYTRDEPGAKQAVVELVALDPDTAFRMLNNTVFGWDFSKLRLVEVDRGVRGPNHFIRINPDIAPLRVCTECGASGFPHRDECSRA